MDPSSAETLNNDEGLEDGEIFEDENPNFENKSAQININDKFKSINTSIQNIQNSQKNLDESTKNQKTHIENDRPTRQENVLFLNKGKRKYHCDAGEEERQWKRDGKRHRRSLEFDHEGDVCRNRQSGDVADDDEDMMFVRGASPHKPDEEADKWDRAGEEEERERFEISRRPNRLYRGRGTIGRRDQRQRGRGRGRGLMRGGKRKRDEPEMCMFFLQGKCHRGSECPYSHEILPPRKMELCKFYMKDCCAKKDKCLYMHSEFPCKYFHTGLKCYANKKCKFNHGQLNESLRNVLAKHLDTAPKDILGEFPRRDQRERGGDQRESRCDQRDLRDSRVEFSRDKSERDRKIPSLFDIKVSIPDEMRTDGNLTPMPSPNQRSQDSTRSSERDRDSYTPDRDRRDKDKERNREHDRHKHDKLERSKEKRVKREKMREHKKERRERREKEKEKKRERSKDVFNSKIDIIENNCASTQIMSPNQDVGEERSIAEGSTTPEQINGESEKRNYQIEENGTIPKHLPKKQQELFLRIQQQQRKAEINQASANDSDEVLEKTMEENWYSSDEETTPSLPPILHSLTATTSTAAPESITSSTFDSKSTMMPLLNVLATASAAAKPMDLNETPTFIPQNLDLSNLSIVFEALTNLQKMKSSSNIEQVKPDVGTENVKNDKAETINTRVRDPRLREGLDCVRGSINNQRRSSDSPHPLDVDLRQHSVKTQSITNDVDLRSLPFKPVQHTAASEIDASLSSHSPIHWNLIIVDLVKPDYASLQIQPKPGVSDPRLRRVVRPVNDELGLPRDPRQRVLDEPVRDPRARQPLLATPILSGPPPTPRYDEDHRQPFFRMDSDMRQFPPLTPRLDDEVYVPGPSRPLDPRQRNLSMDGPRRGQFTNRSDDVDLRTQLPFMNLNK